MPYTAVSRSIWSSRKFRQLDAFERLLFLYLLTNTQVTSLGVYSFHLGHVIADMDLDVADAGRVAQALERLEGLDLIEYDREERLLRVVNFLTFNAPRNPKQGTFLCGLAAELPAGPIREHAIEELLSYENVRRCTGVAKLNGAYHMDTVSKQSRYGIETVSKPRARVTPHPTYTPPTPTPQEEFLKKSKEKKGGPVNNSEQVTTAAKPTREAGLPKSAGEHLANALQKLRPAGQTP